MTLPVRLTGAFVAAFLLGACQKVQEQAPAAPAPTAAESVSEPAATTQAPVAAEWPASLHVFGQGFPKAGDPCRNVGESAATIDFLDHTAWLVGCHSTSDAAALGGKVVGTVDGITLVSIPR